jgi:diketogulonate reductase-like aldo/keto reductase
LDIKKCVIIPKSSNIQHLKSNIELDSFSLDDKDLEIIDNLPKTWRYINPYF